jgi:hypothetical protein
MPMEPVSMEASSLRMSPNMLPVTTTSKPWAPSPAAWRRCPRTCGRAPRRGTAAHFGDHVLPELEGFQHVGLVHAGDACCACARLEGDVGDALDLGRL